MLGKLIQARKNEISGSRSSSINTSEQETVLKKDLDYNPIYQAVKDLEAYKVPGVPDDIFYLPNFITEEDEQTFLRYIYSPFNKEPWHSLPKSGRRLQKLGGDVTADGLITETMPDFFARINKHLSDCGIFKSVVPNHILLNEYPPGIGIMPHTDGPLYYPFVVILSLETNCLFNFHKDYSSFKEGKAAGTLYVERRSLLIFAKDAYHEYLHSINDSKIDAISAQLVTSKSNPDRFDIVTSDVANLPATNLGSELLSGVRKSEFLPSIDEDKSSIYNFEAYFKRERRLSLTIRFVETKK